MNGSEQGDENDELIVEYLVAPPTASPSKILVVEVESSFSLSPFLRANMDVMTPKIPPSSCEDDDDDLDLLEESDDDDDLLGVSLICSRATRRARNSRQSSPIIFSQVFSMRARSLSFDRRREVVAIVVMGGNRCRNSDDEEEEDEHSHEIGPVTVPPKLLVKATESSTASMRRTERYFIMKSAMMSPNDVCQ